MLRKKLILHVGLPKTGTTALQCWCNSHRNELRAQGINYPEVDITLPAPKHQFVVKGLIKNNLKKLHSLIAKNTANTLILSAEALSNNLDSFLPSALNTFKKITSNYDVIIFMIVREEKAWTKSFYKQSVINPPYGIYDATSLRYDDFCQLPKILKLTNIPQLKEDLKTAFNAKEVMVVPYEADWMDIFINMLGVTDLTKMSSPQHANISISDDLIELIRQVNAMHLSHYKRAQFLKIFQDCFQTNHTVLKRMYTGFFATGPLWRRILKQSYNAMVQAFFVRCKNEQVLARLLPETPAQMELINTLRKFLMQSNVAKRYE